MTAPDTDHGSPAPQTAGSSPDEVRAWLIDCVAEHVRLSPEEIVPETPLAAYGLDSITAVSISIRIEDHFAVTLDANAMWDHPTVAALTEMLSGRLLSAA
ncbi:acyl carrier protein [Streptomyces coelicoflavus]|uniref:acyl carrier protein n=1 Tax=Streptomyces coelicoflavus TaxID=285562 RepID=UPI002E27228C